MRIGFACPFKPSVIADLLYPNQQIPNIHPSTTSLSEMIRQIILKGNDVVVFTYVREKCEDICLKGEHVRVYLTSSYAPIKGSIVFSRYYMIKRLKKLIEKEINNLDVLHAHWTYDYAAAAAKFVNKLPVFCTVRDWCPKIILLQKNIPELLYWVVNWFVFKKVMGKKKVRFLANSEYIKASIERQYPQIKTEVIYNIVDERIIVDAHKPIDNKIVYISASQSVGYKLKNIERLVRAFYLYHHENHDSELWLVGAGFTEDGKEVKRWRQQGLMDGVVLYGYVNHDTLMTLFDKATCLVHPSLEESFGNTLIEGMARHIPVIGGEKSGAVPYVLGHGEYGILCDVYDVSSIRNALSKVEDSELINSITRKANVALKQKYSTAHIIAKQIAVYQQGIDLYVNEYNKKI